MQIFCIIFTRYSQIECGDTRRDSALRSHHYRDTRVWYVAHLPQRVRYADWYNTRYNSLLLHVHAYRSRSDISADTALWARLILVSSSCPGVHGGVYLARVPWSSISSSQNPTSQRCDRSGYSHAVLWDGDAGATWAEIWVMRYEL
jgi:hypothetical protein